MATATNGINHMFDMISEAQVKFTGTFSAMLTRNIIKALEEADFYYNPDIEGNDPEVRSEIFGISAGEEQKLTGDFDARVHRAIAKELHFEGVIKR